MAHLELGVEAPQAAADPTLQHLVVIVMSISQGLLKAFQGLLEHAEAQIGIPQAQRHLSIQVQADRCPLHVQTCLAVGDGLLKFAQLFIAAG